jgi:hypothetical protein
VEEDTPNPNEQVGHKRNQKPSVMAASDTAPDALLAQIQEDYICQGIDYLRRVFRGVVVLQNWK